MRPLQDCNKMFFDFVRQYDLDNTNLQRKTIHSFAVAERCYSIACNLKFEEDERQLCYVMGLLHDVGRFKQMKEFSTFNDFESFDHGDIGAIIVKDKFLPELGLNNEEGMLICEAIKNHTKPNNGDDEKTKLYSKIIKNADAFENLIATANGIQQNSLKDDGFSKEIVEAFMDMKPTYNLVPKSKFDRILKMSSNCYYVTFDFLRREILEHNYIDALYEMGSKLLKAEYKVHYKKLMEDLREKLIKKQTV